MLPERLLLIGEIHARQRNGEKAEAALQEFRDRSNSTHVGDIRRLEVLLEMHELEKVEVLLEQYDQQYAGTDKLPLVDSIRAELKERVELNQKIAVAAQKNGRSSSLVSAEQASAERDRMQELKTATTASELEELKTLFLRRPQIGMDSGQVEYAEFMLKLLSEREARMSLSASERARRQTVQAWIWVQKDDYPTAIREAELATKSDPTFGDGWRVAAIAYYLADDNLTALQNATKAIEADPLNAMAHGIRGLILTDQQRLREASKSLSLAFELAPEHPWIQNLLVKTAKASDDRESALIVKVPMKTSPSGWLRLVYLLESTHGRIRTCDLSFRKALLYPLSYAGGTRRFGGAALQYRFMAVW